jgi:hypothetical protein
MARSGTDANEFLVSAHISGDELTGPAESGPFIHFTVRQF